MINVFEVKYFFKLFLLMIFVEVNMVVLCGIDIDIILFGELMIMLDSICCLNLVVFMLIEMFFILFFGLKLCVLILNMEV